MFTRTRMPMTATARFFFDLACAFPLLSDHQIMVAPASMTRMNPIQASLTIRARLSAARALARISSMPASPGAEKVPTIPGKTAQTRQNPAVSAPAILIPDKTFFLSAESSRMNESSHKKPRTGRVNCRITRAMDTVLNLLYSGAIAEKALVNHMKWLPTARKTARTVARTTHHFSFPL